MSQKDEIIKSQLELIKTMTERNMKRITADIWGMSSSATGEESERNPHDDEVTDPDGAQATDGGEKSPSAKTEGEGESLDALLAELNGYIGLESVKREVRSLVNLAKVYKLRRDNSLPVDDISLHMVFSGNPGTGKTMIARFMARVYRSIGLLSKGQLVETDRSGLVAGYIGQTAMKTSEVLKKALGGVLFIDEAYTLINGAENDFGQEAVDTVLKFMEDNRDDIVVIVAGYTELMEAFIESNPGLRSRFNKYVSFRDYTGDEMTDIFLMNCKKGKYVPSDDAVELLREYFDSVSCASGDFGNARGVRNTFERVLAAQADRIASLEEVDLDTLTSIVASDVRRALYPDSTAED